MYSNTLQYPGCKYIANKYKCEIISYLDEKMSNSVLSLSARYVF